MSNGRQSKDTILSRFMRASVVPVYPNAPWFCRCGVGHKAEEVKCVNCFKPRQIWPEEPQVKEMEKEDVAGTTI